MIRTLLYLFGYLMYSWNFFCLHTCRRTEEEWSNSESIAENISEEKLIQSWIILKLHWVKMRLCHAMDPIRVRKTFWFCQRCQTWKDIARNMLRMTATINETFFNSEKNQIAPIHSHCDVLYLSSWDQKPEASMLLPQVDSIMQLQRKNTSILFVILLSRFPLDSSFLSMFDPYCLSQIALRIVDNRKFTSD